MTAIITVKITADELISQPSYHQEQWHIMRKMREAGIPLRGVMKWEGVTRGTLTYSRNPDTEEHCYIWRDES